MNKNQDTFISNCRYLGLKHLKSAYSSLVAQATDQQVSYGEFIQNIVQQETNAKIEGSIRYRIEESKLPRPHKMLADFDFNFQPRLNKKLILQLATLHFF
ncbi:MAG: ATP-binding protein [Candidatus Cyclobacteriaceae bacterium M3_2C_046]